MADFTNEQEEFLRHDPHASGRLVAGPGSGKSFTCVAYLRQATERGLRAKMLTFTRAAAAEFQDTMNREKVEVMHPPSIHSFALQILRDGKWASIPQPVRIADDWETRMLIRPQISRLLRLQGHDDATPSKVAELENEMAAGFQSLGKPLESEHTPELRNAYVGLWGQHRQRLGYVLLSELPYRAANAIEDIGLPDLSLDVLLVDEYQDLNKADINLLHLISERGIPVVAIGDEDQSIYSWRHAHPEGIRGFLDEFGTERDYRLTLSRRCGAEILNAAQDLIEASAGRPKQARMKPFDLEKPGVMRYLRFGNQFDEARAVAAIVSARIAAGVSPRKIAVLVRSGVAPWAASMKWAFEERGIVIASAGWVEQALDDKELRRVRAMALLAIDPNDSLAWMSLLSLTDGVGGTTLDRIYLAAHGNETFAQVLDRMMNESLDRISEGLLKRLRARIQEIREGLGAFAVPDERPEEGWGGWLRARCSDRLGEDADLLLKLVNEKADREAGLPTFLGQMEPLGKDHALSEMDGVRFMTMASSKGLTMDTVVVVGAEEGNIPSPKGDPEEERRLLYVAMTRATDYCVLTLCRRRDGPIARRGRENLAARVRSPLLENVIAPEDGNPWLTAQGW